MSQRTGPRRNAPSAQSSGAARPLVIGLGVLVLVVAAIAAVLIYSRSAGQTPAQQTGNMVVDERAIPDQGGGLHTRTLMEAHPAYNSNPPTSGWHYGGGWLQSGVYDTPQPDELMVHSLEHGMVVIHYRQDLDQATVGKLVDLTKRLQQQSDCIVTVPRPTNRLDVPIAVTAWARLLELRGYDEAAITGFFQRRVGHGYEQICRPLMPDATVTK